MTTILMSYGNAGASPWAPKFSCAPGVVERARRARRLSLHSIQEGCHEHVRIDGARPQAVH